jgi:hypothetical protein
VQFIFSQQYRQREREEMGDEDENTNKKITMKEDISIFLTLQIKTGFHYHVTVST